MRCFLTISGVRHELHQLTRSLIKSGRQEQEEREVDAMQPTPNVTRADVERVLRRDFPPERVAEVLAMLDEYGPDDWHREPERVRLAVLKLAAGNLERLRYELEGAKRDYRDVLSPAEYPGYTARKCLLAPNFRRRKSSGLSMRAGNSTRIG